MIDLKNKTALITGGSRGIGRACVRFLSKAGADVAFTYNSNKKLANKLCDEFTDKNKVRSFKVNTNNKSDIYDVINSVKNDFGKIDILVNNAGIWE